MLLCWYDYTLYIVRRASVTVCWTNFVILYYSHWPSHRTVQYSEWFVQSRIKKTEKKWIHLFGLVRFVGLSWRQMTTLIHITHRIDRSSFICSSGNSTILQANVKRIWHQTDLLACKSRRWVRMWLLRIGHGTNATNRFHIGLYRDRAPKTNSTTWLSDAIASAYAFTLMSLPITWRPWKIIRRALGIQPPMWHTVHIRRYRTTQAISIRFATSSITKMRPKCVTVNWSVCPIWIKPYRMFVRKLWIFWIDWLIMG